MVAGSCGAPCSCGRGGVGVYISAAAIVGRFVFIPSVKKVYRAIRALRGDSAVGEDGLSAFILQAGGWQFAVMIHQVIVDIIRLEYVPIVWRGGKLVVLYKGKGSAAVPDNYRGILVGDHLSKILTSLLQWHLEETYCQEVGTCQFGAVRNKSTAMASLMLRSFLDMCTLFSWSCFVLFLDLSKAFDYAVREVVMGWMRGTGDCDYQARRDHLVRLGIPADVADEIAQWIDESGGLLKSCDVDDSVCALVNSVHDGAWFRLPTDDKYVVTVSGGRQGCKLGALIFNLIYSIALKRLRNELVPLGIVLKVRRRNESPFWASLGVETEWTGERCADSETFEVTYVDDEAAYIAATSVRTLMQAIPLLMKHLCAIFAYFGFKINWNPGKTECFLVLRGKGSAAKYREIAANNSQIIFSSSSDVPALRVVQVYKHLGSILEKSGAAAPDVPHRVTSAMSAYVPLALKVFGAARIARSVRLHLFFSLVVSRLIYNVHVWSNITQAMYTTLNSAYMRGLRRIIGQCR